MRKKTLFQTIDNLVWFIIALLPLFAYLIINIGDKWFLLSDDFLDSDYFNLAFILRDFFANPSPNLGSSIYTVIDQIFSSTYGLGGLSTSFKLYITYFCTVQLVHIVVDLLLFVPKIACKWLEKIGGAD